MKLEDNDRTTTEKEVRRKEERKKFRSLLYQWSRLDADYETTRGLSDLIVELIPSADIDESSELLDGDG